MKCCHYHIIVLNKAQHRKTATFIYNETELLVNPFGYILWRTTYVHVNGLFTSVRVHWIFKKFFQTANVHLYWLSFRSECSQFACWNLESFERYIAWKSVFCSLVEGNWHVIIYLISLAKKFFCIIRCRRTKNSRFVGVDKWSE